MPEPGRKAAYVPLIHTIEEHRKEVSGRLVSMMKCAQESRGHPELHTAAVYDMGILPSPMNYSIAGTDAAVSSGYEHTDT